MLPGQKKLPGIAQVLQRLVFLRLFLPLVSLSVLIIGGGGYLGKQALESQQNQRAQSLARIVDRYLDQAARTLDAVARAAEISPPEDLATFMQSTWEAYGYFDTLYSLDAGSKITLLAPPDPRYLGLDMSSMPYFQQTGEKNNQIISRPFISVRTGDPTVYLVSQLAREGQMVGELSLEALQEEITHSRDAGQDLTFILDQSGMLLAHPSFDLVKQRTNQSHLEIFRRGLGGNATLIYEYAGTMVLGSAVRVDQPGWVVVDQVPISVALSPYAWALGLTLSTLLAIWLGLTWNLRSQLHRHVVVPLVQLSRGIGALANGDFSQGKALASIPGAFTELTSFVADFQHMSDALEARQAALQESEERYRRLNTELEQRVFNRTIQLEASNKELEAFAYSVSHDLRAPLRHIDGFVNLLKMKEQESLDEQSHHYMASIENSANKMGTLIDDLLSFSRMGRQTMSLRPVDLGLITHEVIQELETDTTGRNIEWQIGNLPTVDGDASMLRIVLTNLISNAVKYTRPREEVRIEIGMIPDQNAEPVIFVCDNGVGFDMMYADKLFGVFQRLHHSDEFEGTGVGLANVYRIIARHGGRVWAEGKIDEGATFYFSLPQKQPASRNLGRRVSPGKTGRPQNVR